MDRRTLMLAGGVIAAGGAVSLARGHAGKADAAVYPLRLTTAQWRSRLSAGQFAVLREAATEAPGASALLNEHRRGQFACAGCALPLFSSSTKFESGTGWPSFYAPLRQAVATSKDFSMIIPRTEVHCSRCGGHLGHLFDDGPRPTGLRYCMNGVAMTFRSA